MIFYWLSYLAIPFLAVSFWQLKKTRFKNISWLASVIFFLLLIWARFVEPNLVKANYYPLADTGDQPGTVIKVAVLSDTHIGRFTKPYLLAEAVKKINLANPDLVLIPGDIVYGLKPEKMTRWHINQLF